MSNTQPIGFFTRDADTHGWMSNFHEAWFVFGSASFRTVEHAFQAHKTAIPAVFEDIRTARTPRDAKRLGRAATLIRGWDQIKIPLMGALVMSKFSQNEDLARLLILTGDRQIEEDSPFDSFWGTGKDGNGRNEMGHILMQVRSSIR